MGFEHLDLGSSLDAVNKGCDHTGRGEVAEEGRDQIMWGL